MATRRKKPADRRPVAVARSKEIFLKWLAKGRAPADAAEKVGLSRSAVYAWKKDDAEFDAKWINAVESSLDKVESALFKSAYAGDASNLQFILKWRRRQVYNNLDNDRPQPTSLVMNITLQEQFKRLERLGLPLPVIESDYEEITDAAADDRDEPRE